MIYQIAVRKRRKRTSICVPARSKRRSSRTRPARPSMQRSAGPIARPPIWPRSCKSKAFRSASMPCGGFCSTSSACRVGRRSRTKPACDYEYRDEQFQHIAAAAGLVRAARLAGDQHRHEKEGNPGRFLPSGPGLSPTAACDVQDHDFVTAEQAAGALRRVRHAAERGLACIWPRGADTSELACDAIWRWWQRLGRRHYWHAPRLLLLCDCGGSNGNRQQRFKEELCYLACDLQMRHRKWPTIRPAARSTIRSSIACSATSRAPAGRRAQDDRGGQRLHRPHHTRPRACASSPKSRGAPIRKDSKPPATSSTTTPFDSTTSCPTSTTPPLGQHCYDANAEVISRWVLSNA